MIAKLLIMLFPILAIIAFFSDNFLGLRSVAAYMIYHLFISIANVFYELYACTWGHHEEPGFLYKPNDLVEHSN